MNETHITVTGNVATDPEHKLTSTGDPMTKFRVATSERMLDRASGTWTDGPTSYYVVSIFRAAAPHVFHALRKGDPVIVTGRLRIRNWESGEKQGTDADIDASSVGFDLRWGIGRFERERSGAAPASPNGTDPASGDAQQTWPAVAIPREDDSVPAGAEGGAAAEGRPALVPAGGDTPF